MNVEGRDEHGRCGQGHYCCIAEAPGHGDPHTLGPERCGWCLSHERDQARRRAASPTAP